MIEFKKDEDGFYWEASSAATGEAFLRSPSFKTKKKAAGHLGRTKGSFRELEPKLKWVAGLTEGSGPELEKAGREHAGEYAVMAAQQILEDVYPTSLTITVLTMLEAAQCQHWDYGPNDPDGSKSS